VITKGASETVKAIVSLLRDERTRRSMALRSNSMARPAARREIARLAVDLSAPEKEELRRMTA
jgi:hypothetical protein